MAHKGLYRHFRPLIVISCIMGDVALNITAKNSDELFTGYLSWTMVLLVLKLPLCPFGLLSAIPVKNVVGHYYRLIRAAALIATQIWLYAVSYHIALSFRALDKMRAMIDQLPQALRPQHCNPTQFVWIALTIFLLEHVSVMLVPMFYEHVYDYNYITYVLVLIVNVGTKVRYILTLSSLFYSFSLLLKECCYAFRLLLELDVGQSYNLRVYSTMLFSLHYMMKGVYHFLGQQVLILITVRVYYIITNLLFYAMARSVEAVNLLNMTKWSVMFAFLIVCMGLSSCQANKLKETIIRTPLNVPSKRDCFRIKALLACLHHSEGLTSVGFVTINTALFLSLLTFEIDYFITLQQNMSFLKQLIGLEDRSNLTNTTLTP